MLILLHILGNGTHESVQRSIMDEALFFKGQGADVRFAYDPASLLASDTDYIDVLNRYGFTLYKFPYLPRAAAQNIQAASGETSRPPNGADAQHNPPNESAAPQRRLTPFYAALTLREMCYEYPIDVIRTHSEQAYRLACAACCLGARAVHIYTVHGVTERKSPALLYNRLLSVWCDNFIAADNYTAGVLLDRLIRADKIKRVNYGIDLSYWKTPAKTADGNANAAAVSHESLPENANGSGETTFTFLFIADSDPIGDGSAYDAFADLALRLTHDFNPQASAYKKLRCIIATNSSFGPYYANELINDLDLSDCVEILRLSGPSTDVSPDSGGSAWMEQKIGNWKASEAKIKLTSFKYNDENKKKYGAQVKAGGFRNLYCKNAETSRQALYSRADCCVYYSENRFFPYPAAEAIAFGVPTLTNDVNFFYATEPAGNVFPSDAYIDFGDPEALARRALSLIFDGEFRVGIVAAEENMLQTRYDIEDMYVSVYDLYVRGLRV